MHERSRDAVVMDHLLLGLDHLAEGKDLLGQQVSRRHAFWGIQRTVVDSQGVGNNQCGSASMVPRTGVVLTTMALVLALASSSVSSAGNLGTGLSLGYSSLGAGRQGDGGLLPEALRGDDGRDKCTKCSSM